MSKRDEHPDTDALNYTEGKYLPDGRSDLTIHSFRGGVLTLVSQLVKFALQLGSVVILARILTPEDYGLFAIVIAIVVFFNLLKDMGLQMSTIQQDQVTDGQISNLFWISIASGTAFAVLAVAFAPLVGRMYNEPRLAAMLAVMSLVYIANALSSQQQAILKRTMRFGILALIEILSMTAGVLIAVIAAMQGAGYWALVYMHISMTVLSAGGFWWTSNWRPQMPKRGLNIRPMLHFGWHITAMGILAFACRNLDTLLIGWYSGTRELGLYQKAYQLLLIPLLNVEIPLSGFALSILSRAVTKREEFRRQYVGIVLSIASIGMAAIAFLCVAAEKTVLVFLGPRWLSIVPMFHALAPAAFVDTFLLTLNWVLMSLGETARLFRLMVVVTIITVSGFVIGLPWGALGVAVAYSCCRVGITIPMIIYISRHSPIRLKDFLRTLAKPVIVSIAAAAGLSLISPFCIMTTNKIAGLMLDGLIFLILYVSLWLMMPGGRHTIAEIVRLLITVTKKTSDIRS